MAHRSPSSQPGGRHRFRAGGGRGRYGDAAMAEHESEVGSAREAMLRSLYEAFNSRDVDTALAGMTPDVDWANGWEGGSVSGREAVRDYWRRQWEEIDSSAVPTVIEARPDGRVAVTVHLVARDQTGAVVNDSTGRHVYDFRGDLVERMTIED
jgi:nuclear transport factor 2 (NTF2) superfamily protein